MVAKSQVGYDLATKEQLSMKDEMVGDLFLLLVMSKAREQGVVNGKYFTGREGCSQVYQRLYHGTQRTQMNS